MFVCFGLSFCLFFFFFSLSRFPDLFEFHQPTTEFKKKKKNNRPVEIHIFAYLFLILNYHNAQAHKERAGDKGIMEIQELK